MYTPFVLRVLVAVLMSVSVCVLTTPPLPSWWHEYEACLVKAGLRVRRTDESEVSLLGYTDAGEPLDAYDAEESYKWNVIDGLPDEVFGGDRKKREQAMWGLLMIDAPYGWFTEVRGAIKGSVLGKVGAMDELYRSNRVVKPAMVPKEVGELLKRVYEVYKKDMDGGELDGDHRMFSMLHDRPFVVRYFMDQGWLKGEALDSVLRIMCEQEEEIFTRCYPVICKRRVGEYAENVGCKTMPEAVKKCIGKYVAEDDGMREKNKKRAMRVYWGQRMYQEVERRGLL